MRLKDDDQKSINDPILLCSPIIIKRDQRFHHKKNKNGQANKHIFASK